MKFYQIVAHGTRLTSSGWRECLCLPTFYLRNDIQGITTAWQAELIALRMLERLAPNTAFTVGVSVSTDFDPATIGIQS